MTDVWNDPRIARAYAEVRTELSDADRARWAGALRTALANRPVRRVLDVGCGTGRFTWLLAELFGAHVIGVDGSADMLREARSGASPTIRFVNADAAHLPIRDGSTDLAMLSMVYHLLAPPEPALAELARVLHAGGAVVVRTPTREHLAQVPFLRFFPEAQAIDERRIPSATAIEATLAAEGFRLETHRTIEQEFAPSPDAALAKVRRRPFSVLRLIPDEAFEAGLTRYEAHCRAASDGRISEPLDLFVFTRR